MSTKIQTDLQSIGDIVTNGVIAKSHAKPFQTEYPKGCIGADLIRRNYIRYLVERYHRFKEAELPPGETTRSTYAVIYKNIETKFKTPTYFVPTSRFEELADYLKSRIDQTILGKRKRSCGSASYSSFDEFQFEQSTANESA